MATENLATQQPLQRERQTDRNMAYGLETMLASGFNQSGSTLEVFIQEGDSMAPDFPGGTVFIVDTSIRHHVKDGLYLLHYGGTEGTAIPPTRQVRRVIRNEFSLDSYTIHHDNPAYIPEDVMGEDLNIAGLVINSIICQDH